MSRFYKISIFCCLLVVFGVEAAKRQAKSDGQPCGDGEMNKLDQLISSMLPFKNPDVPPPERLEDIPEFCKHYGGILNEIEALNKKCMKEEYRNMISIMIYNIKKGSKGICGKKALQSKKMTPMKKQFLELNHCINGAKPQLGKCSDEATAHLAAIESQPKSERVPMLCCEMHHIKDCVMKSLKTQPGCDGDDFEEKLKAKMKEHFGGGGNQMATICADYTKVEKCDKVKIPKLKDGHKIPNSFITPLIHIIGEL